MNTTFSRRQVLAFLVKAAGGSAALMQAAGVLGITPKVPPFIPQKLTPVSGKKPHVIILGAGISGLVSAYELGRAGYDYTVLEASGRIGGRNMTVRRGDVIDQIGDRQVCQFDDQPNLYFNCGPARLPAEHQGILHYCKELGVPLQLFCNYNRNCYTQDDNAFDGKPIRIREYEADVRGFMSELLAKTMHPADLLNAPFNDADFERMVEFVKAFGDLDKNNQYKGSQSAGFASNDALLPPKLKQPHRFADLLKSHFWAGAMHFIDIADQSPAMMTPIGGMDSIVRHFIPQLRKPVTVNAQVQKIRVQDDGVEISFVHNGTTRVIRGDYCLNCIPSQILVGLDHNFPDDYSAILSQIERGKLIKFGLQAKQRFWENEEIYAGISWTNQDITQLWYPEHGAMMEKGILLGGYSWVPEIVERFSAMSHAQRMEIALKQGEKLHPNYRQHIENGVSICWNRMNHLMGCGSIWSKPLYEKGFKLLQAGVAGRHFMMGDQMGLLPGWQEGAVQSAWHALNQIEQHAEASSRRALS